MATPIDHDSIATAEQEATAAMRRYPQLQGWVVSDAGGGIGVGRAITPLGKTGTVKVVVLDDLPELLALINSGVVDSTTATKPRSQGYWAVISLWQQGLGAPPIERIDTGIGVQGWRRPVEGAACSGLRFHVWIGRPGRRDNPGWAVRVPHPSPCAGWRSPHGTSRWWWRPQH